MGHGVHAPAPSGLYVPAKHSTAVGEVLPAGHAYPALHGAVHCDNAAAGAAPYCPGSQGPEQAEVVRPLVAP
jgi:hypothetical protein